jgi:hypothetical protein
MAGSRWRAREKSVGEGGGKEGVQELQEFRSYRMDRVYPASFGTPFNAFGEKSGDTGRKLKEPDESRSRAWKPHPILQLLNSCNSFFTLSLVVRE